MSIVNDWKACNVGNLLSGKTGEAAVVAVQAQVSKATEFLETAQEKLAFYTNKVAELVAEVDNLNKSIGDLGADTLSTGVYGILLSPEKDGSAGLSNRLSASMNNTADEDRPIFSSSAYVGGIVILYGCPSLSGAQSTAKAITRVYEKIMEGIS